MRGSARGRRVAWPIINGAWRLSYFVKTLYVFTHSLAIPAPPFPSFVRRGVGEVEAGLCNPMPHAPLIFSHLSGISTPPSLPLQKGGKEGVASLSMRMSEHLQT